jgi:hypothetical protein
MRSSSLIYCSVCGAANQAQATQCFACGHLLETPVEDTVPPSPAGLSVSRPLLAGRYRIIALVGEGGFGAVYKAVDLQRDEALVALKQINLSGLRPRDVIEATETFNREVGMLSDLKHPNLPRIYDYFTDAEHWYLAMDFIEGETLEEYLKSATTSGDGTVQVWNATDGSHVYTYGHSDIVTAVAWSPDGRRIVSGSNDNTAQVRDASTGSSVLTYKGHSDVVEAVAWSPDGKRIASGSDDHTVQIWKAP